MKRTLCLSWLATLALALSSTGSTAQTPDPRAGEVTALLPVALIHRGTASPIAAELHGEVRWRDLMETQPRARARLELLDGSVLNIGSAAKVRIVRHDEQSQQTEIELTLGKVRAKVQRLTRSGSAFSIRTNTAVLGVIGTHVYAGAEADTTAVINLDTGRTRVRSSDPAVAGEQVLEPFELTTVAQGQAPTPKRPATFEEILQATLDTLPGPSLALGVGHARVGSCMHAVVGTRLADPDADGVLASSSFLNLTPAACAGGELTPVRVCIPDEAAPGLYEFALPTAAGEQLSALLVRPVEPPNPLEGAHFVYAPEAPPGSVHYARLLDAQNRSLEGIPVRLLSGKEETVTHTDSNGGLAVRVPESGSAEFRAEVAGSTTSGTSAGPAPVPITGRVQAARLENLQVPDLVQRGSVVNVPGEVTNARLGESALSVTRTITGTGETISTVALPPESAAGASDLQLQKADGQVQQHRVVIFDVLSARLDQPALTSQMQTAGEFLACVGDARLKDVRARIVAAGPVRFRGKGAKGKVYERKLPVGPNGLVRIPFEIRADKAKKGQTVPYALQLTLTR